MIGHYYCFLVDNLDNSVVCQIMLELKLLTERDLLHCAQMYSGHQQNAFLLDQLLAVGTASIDEFCHMLQNAKNQPELGCILVNGENYVSLISYSSLPLLFIAIESIPVDDVHMMINNQSSSISSQPTSSDDAVISFTYQPEMFLAAKTVHRRFLNLVSQLKQKLKDCDLESFLAACSKITATGSHLKPISVIPSEYLEDLDNAGIEEIFSRLSFLWTWISHSILRALLEACDCQDGIKMLDDFESQIDTNQPMEFFPIPPPSLKMAPSLSSAYTVLSIRHEDDENEFIPLQYVDNVATIMIEKFSISPHTLQLLAARTTPLMLYWIIPKSVVPLISKGVNENLRFLKENRCLEIGIYPNTILFATDNLNTGLFSLLSNQPSVSKYVFV